MSKSTKTITTTQYAKSVKKSRQSVCNAAKIAIEKGSLHLLPNVKKVEQAGKYYLLTVAASFVLSES